MKTTRKQAFGLQAACNRSLKKTGIHSRKQSGLQKLGADYVGFDRPPLSGTEFYETAQKEGLLKPIQ